MNQYQWPTTVAQMKLLGAELIRAAETMGGDDEESHEVELVLAVAPAATVQDDDGDWNAKPILTVRLEEYPEEGVYPVDPHDPTGGRIDAPCLTCNGHGMVGGLTPHSGYDAEPCPDCTPPASAQDDAKDERERGPVDVLGIARETGLRSYLHGVNAMEARMLLQRFVDALPVAPAAGDARALNIEAAAKAMAECMDYPWAHMPEQGRAAMREHAQTVIRAASQQQEG